MAKSNLDRELDELIAGIAKAVGKFLKNLCQGAKRLKGKRIVVFLMSLGVTILICRQHNRLFGLLDSVDMPVLMQKALYLVLLCIPLFYLAILGGQKSKEQQEYNEKFEKIGFKEATGNYPYFLAKEEDDKKRTIYTFRSNLSLGEWRKKSEQLENANLK